MIEIELTYLLKYLPIDIKQSHSKRITDIYYPIGAEHPTLRLRERGNVYEMTKKSPISGKDSSIQEEQTISLSQSEFRSFSVLPGKKLEKTRYFYQFGNYRAEIDIFEGSLRGLVLADFEFKSSEEMKTFSKPDFCLIEVTQDQMIAGGMLAGKSYGDLELKLKSLGYQKIDY